MVENNIELLLKFYKGNSTVLTLKHVISEEISFVHLLANMNEIFSKKYSYHIIKRSFKKN